ncbi:glycosyltransferase family 4 protein [Pseudoclavibacter sp. CFCC 11306]|nr:glycosyltransferase family 4 protein [Pseudoclavibacter sp. CFCC 11306]
MIVPALFGTLEGVTQTPHDPPLRILIGCDTFSPDVNGAARFTERLAAGLKQRGYDVHIVAPATSRRTAGTSTEVIEGVPMTVHRWPSWRWYPHDWLRFVWPLTIRRRARALLDEVKPDVVHFQSFIIVGRGLAIEAHARGIRVIGTNHFMPENGVEFTGLPANLDRKLIDAVWREARKVFALAQFVTTPTQRAADYLERCTGLRDVLPVSCGIRASDYSPQLVSDDPGVDQRLVFVGRVTEEKQIDVALRALASLPPELHVGFDIVGGGDQLDRLKRLAVVLGVSDSVVFHGRVTDEHLRRVLSEGSVFVMPSIAELQSIATMEAMASGLPVVAADAMALPHLVHDGENGYLFRAGDVADLTAKLTTVLRQSQAERLRMQRASLQGVRVHDIDRTLDVFEQLYHGHRPKTQPADASNEPR